MGRTQSRAERLKGYPTRYLLHRFQRRTMKTLDVPTFTGLILQTVQNIAKLVSPGAYC